MRKKNNETDFKKPSKDPQDNKEVVRNNEKDFNKPSRDLQDT